MAVLAIRRVQGESMLPAYKPGQLVLVRPVDHAVDALRPGDVVIVRHEGLEKLKRVRRVRAGGVFVMGDNAAQSTDSRSFGWLPTRAVWGRILWPKRPI